MTRSTASAATLIVTSGVASALRPHHHREIPTRLVEARIDLQGALEFLPRVLQLSLTAEHAAEQIVGLGFVCDAQDLTRLGGGALEVALIEQHLRQVAARVEIARARGEVLAVVADRVAEVF